MNLNTLPFYEKLELFTRVPDHDFRQLCVLDREMSSVCSGIVSDHIKNTYGPGISEQLYEARVRRFYDEKFLKFKGDSSWKRFYKALTFVTDQIDQKTNLSDYFFLKQLIVDRDLLELKIIQDIVSEKEVNIVAMAVATLDSDLSYDDQIQILTWILSLERDDEKLMNEVSNVIGNYNTLLDALIVSSPGGDINSFPPVMRDFLLNIKI